MGKKNQNNDSKVVHINTLRKGKQAKNSVVVLLHDTRRAAKAIQNKTCLLCHEQKLCVNKTGLCASCYNNLSPEEKRIADSEAGHKIIEVKVLDDRWNDGDQS